MKVFDYLFLSPQRFAIWNTMMGTSILSIPWGIKQVICLISRPSSLKVTYLKWHVLYAVCVHIILFWQETKWKLNCHCCLCPFRLVLLWGFSYSSSQACWCFTVVTSSLNHQRLYVSVSHRFSQLEQIFLSNLTQCENSIGDDTCCKCNFTILMQRIN